MDTNAIRKAVSIAGGQSALAKRLKVSQSLVWQWCVGRLKVPAERCLAIETEADGQVSRYDLRPDVFGTAPERELEQTA